MSEEGEREEGEREEERRGGGGGRRRMHSTLAARSCRCGGKNPSIQMTKTQQICKFSSYEFLCACVPAALLLLLLHNRALQSRKRNSFWAAKSNEQEINLPRFKQVMRSSGKFNQQTG